VDGDESGPRRPSPLPTRAAAQNGRLKPSGEKEYRADGTEDGGREVDDEDEEPATFGELLHRPLHQDDAEIAEENDLQPVGHDRIDRGEKFSEPEIHWALVR